MTQEYTGQQRHVCYLGPLWSEVLGFGPWGPDGARRSPDGRRPRTGRRPSTGRRPGRVSSNVGDDPFWTGHPLAQANLYAFGRLAWDPQLDPVAILDEWIGLTFARGDAGIRDAARRRCTR